ncbi:hypothetical protein F4604DRAFT_1877194 [Suillus subluteus]|nr:hypothetical protein F4604DRAFT_1877194 [Suillus subluteus]
MPTIPPVNAVNSVLQLMLENEISLLDLTKAIISTLQRNYQLIKESLQQHTAEICHLLFLSTGCREVVFGWAFEKTVICACIFAQSSNECCNTLQCIFSLFLHSTGTLQRVIEALTHAGISISTQSIAAAVRSLSKEVNAQIKQAVWTLTTALAYDNFDIDFKTAQPTIEHQSQFISSTSATAIPLYGINNHVVLRCSHEIQQNESSSLVRASLAAGKLTTKDLHIFHQENSYGTIPPGKCLSPHEENFAWHVCDILLNHGKYFDFLKHHHDDPVIVNAIPLHKTRQSTTDGNIEVMDTLLRQGGIGECEEVGFDLQYDVDMSEHVLLIHGDLLTKERLDMIIKSRHIEDTPKCHFQHVVFVPGLFHFKMACANAL